MGLKDPALRVVLYEGDGSEPLTPEQRYEAVSALLEAGYGVTRAARAGAPAPADASPLLILGRFAGATPAWEDRAAQVSVTVLELGEAADAAALADAAREGAGAARHGEWKPWFPVIDYDRCTNCMQCLSFCLFGVYGVDAEQRIQVQNNDNCKTNCPACSRVCPEAAIMFPKYKSGPINGDAVSSGDLEREKMKVDISSLLGGDVYSMLRQRSERAQSRFSKERSSDKALNERQKCLTKLKESMDVDIPPEVLMSLPSQDDILERAKEAKSKAEQALKARGGA